MDNKKRVEILLLLLGFLNVIILWADFEREKNISMIEENLLLALGQGMTNLKISQEFQLRVMSLTNAYISYVDASSSSNIADRERNRQDLNGKVKKFEIDAENYLKELNKSFSIEKSLRREIEEPKYWREIIYKYRPWLDLLAAILIIGAIYLTLRMEDDTKKILKEVKKDNGKLKDSMKKLEYLLISDQVEAWNDKGRILYSLGKYNEAIKAYDKSIKINPQNPDAWNSKGNILKLLGRTTEASAAFAKAKELDLQPNPSVG